MGGIDTDHRRRCDPRICRTALGASRQDNASPGGCCCRSARMGLKPIRPDPVSEHRLPSGGWDGPRPLLDFSTGDELFPDPTHRKYRSICCRNALIFHPVRLRKRRVKERASRPHRGEMPIAEISFCLYFSDRLVRPIAVAYRNPRQPPSLSLGRQMAGNGLESLSSFCKPGPVGTSSA